MAEERILVFAKAQDPNGYNYPLAFAVLDGENHASWTWFSRWLKVLYQTLQNWFS